MQAQPHQEGVAGSQQARFDELPPGALIADCVCAGAPASPWLCRVSLMSQWTLLVIAVNWQQCQDYIALLQREVPTVICMGGGYSRPIEPTVIAHSDVYRMAALALAGEL